MVPNILHCYHQARDGVWKVCATHTPIVAALLMEVERLYPHAVYALADATPELYLLPSHETPPVRWSSVSDPDFPDALPPEAHPIHITLTAGDTLYLPVGWWHFVRQSGDVTIALNWWYDAELQGINWVWLNMLRAGDNVPGGN